MILAPRHPPKIVIIFHAPIVPSRYPPLDLTPSLFFISSLDPLMAAPVPPSSAQPTNGPTPAPAPPAPSRVSQRDGGNTSLGTFGVRPNLPPPPHPVHLSQVKSGLAQMLKVQCHSRCHSAFLISPLLTHHPHREASSWTSSMSSR